MPLLPDWAPNLHPLIVHFPIALLFIAAVFDSVAFVAKDRGGWRLSATTLFLLGAAGAVAAYFTGQQAADSVFVPTAANALLTEHADLGTYTMYYFAAYGLLRLALSFGKVGRAGLVRGLLLLGGIGGLVLLTIAADHGAELVFRHGVGVEAVENAPAASDLPPDSVAAASGGWLLTDTGWTLTSARAGAWLADAVWFEGDATGLETALVDGGDRGDVLQLRTLSEAPAGFAFPSVLSSVQVDLTADLSAFDGTLIIAHHLQDDGSYGFASIGNGAVRFGRSEDGDLLVTDTAPFEMGDWRDVRLVVDGTHYRLYVDREVVLHGHGDSFTPGRIGLRLNGGGAARIGSVQVTELAATTTTTTTESKE